MSSSLYSPLSSLLSSFPINDYFSEDWGHKFILRCEWLLDYWPSLLFKFRMLYFWRSPRSQAMCKTEGARRWNRQSTFSQGHYSLTGIRNLNVYLQNEIIGAIGRGKYKEWLNFLSLLVSFIQLWAPWGQKVCLSYHCIPGTHHSAWCIGVQYLVIRCLRRHDIWLHTQSPRCIVVLRAKVLGKFAGRQLLKWLLVIPTSWCSALVPSPWAWTGLRDSLLTAGYGKHKGRSPPRLGYKRLWGFFWPFLLALLVMPTAVLWAALGGGPHGVEQGVAYGQQPGRSWGLRVSNLRAPESCQWAYKGELFS